LNSTAAIKYRKRMTTTVEAIYEHGTLRLKEPISLQDGAEVEVIVIAQRNNATNENPTPAELLAKISQLPLEGTGDGFSARNHDQLLYGGKGTR
jgi:predicted DNA-binding antitoxin AbrB/MazE fold protein